MRLLIAEHNHSTGTETVSLGIIPELLQRAERVVWAMPSYRIEFYQKIIPASDRLIYRELFWPPDCRFHWRLFGLLQQMDLLLPRSKIVAGMRARLTDSWLKYLIRHHGITHFFTTWIFNVEIPRLPVPVGAMAMDLNWHQFPENFPESDRESLDRSFAKWLAEADVVFPISDFTADEMKREFPQSVRRLKVVPHGARILPPAEMSVAAGARPYFYYPASVFAHKDHRTAIEAAIDLFSRGHDFDLIFSGVRTECLLSQNESSNPLSESLRALIEENSKVIKGRIKCLGVVDRAQVETLVLGARALVLPSRFEGFGLPLLEAIERGARVICTDIPPFLEQIHRYDYSGYATVFPAGDAVQLSSLIQTAISKPVAPRPLPAEITARAQRWTWKDAAAAYVDALQEA